MLMSVDHILENTKLAIEDFLLWVRKIPASFEENGCLEEGKIRSLLVKMAEKGLLCRHPSV
jgi:hypothetical protein